ncbi:MAG: tol-pal system-associated acyl-CoA thioesterase [Gammaproteobacteria bacterium]|nr:tol-pal system-associated acyl-CoA thioesterase [Gammaproteobacteria bacterium]
MLDLKTITLPAFILPVRVYYEDTDAGGVVYHSNYLKFMERARTEWLRSLGFELDELAQREGALFVVRSANVEFLRPARFNELVNVTVTLSKRRSASFTLMQQIRRADEPLCEGEIRIVCLDVSSFTPRPLPDAVAARLDGAN